MATRNVTGSFVSNSENVSPKLIAVGESPSGPYVDGRLMGGYFETAEKQSSYAFTVGTTVDNAGNVIANADDVVVDVGFIPALIILQMEDAAGSEMFVKPLGAAGAYAWKFDSGVAGTYTNNALTSANGYVTIGNAITTNTKLHTLTVIGR